ncbi:DUF2511 domain-containing protein [Ectopseudomonas chengduensis]|nr:MULTISPECIES: DUF2511 domain-containing protein [Pseudomonas]MDZ4190748.1 DUF2511 domain-containing protein [Pseudomonas sp.]UZT76198.1 DUF2511 domain-containing protein [Pseudomonas chengduensis]
MAIAGAFSFATVAAQQDLISAEDFGNDWPFTFEEGYVACHAGNAVTVMDAETGRMYSLNGAAKGKASALGLDDLEAVWLDNPEIAGTRVSVSAVIDTALKLCR